MICPQCQADNREGVKFCEECGAKMEIQCPQCRAVIPLGKRFCGECGHDRRKPKESVPIDYDEPQSYTPKHLADKILSNRAAIEGERKLVTILFADVANSTAMFENLSPWFPGSSLGTQIPGALPRTLAGAPTPGNGTGPEGDRPSVNELIAVGLGTPPSPAPR